MRATGWAIALLVMAPDPAVAEWQVRPFIGLTFAGATTFQDPEVAIGTQDVVFGASGGWLGEIFGLEADFGRSSGMFERDDAPEAVKLLSSGVTTLTGHVVVALPRRIAGYGLRPYFSGGAGLMHVDVVGKLGAVDIHRTLPALSVGGGVTGFLSNRVGVNWDVRRLSTVRGEGETLGNSVGNESLSFWRATMAVAIRY
ncbi:MAG TPA: outer membrane beta-barrel protein [Vicinamibacterales bacterium]|nr:outer membrane beta-barrel protein [Vicinamibacterales bacterium]